MNYCNVRTYEATRPAHREAITSRPLLMSAFGKLTESGNQKKIKLTSHHKFMDKIANLQTQLCVFFDSIKNLAPQLTPIQAWCRILTKAVSKFLKKGQVIAPLPLIDSSCPLNIRSGLNENLPDFGWLRSVRLLNLG